MDEYYNSFLKKGFSPAFGSQPVDSVTLDKFKGKLPERLLSYWENYGFCGYGEGLFWTVNPNDYEDLLEKWLGSSEIWGREKYYVIARTAFGELFVIGEDSIETTIINPYLSNILPGEGPDKILSEDERNRYIGIFFQLKKPKSLDFLDNNDKPLFKRALKKLGQLNHDEMYTFVPALVTGGKADIYNLQIVKLQDQLSLLAELDTPVMLRSVNELLGG